MSFSLVYRRSLWLRLRRVMNAAVRFMAGLGPRDHVTTAWRDLHWLPIKQLCIMNDACCQ